MANCKNLKNFLNIQMEIIEKHIDEHKWFTHIEDKNAALIDFANKFAWTWRELYCGYSCEFRDSCELSKPYKPKKQKNIEIEYYI